MLFACFNRSPLASLGWSYLTKSGPHAAHFDPHKEEKMASIAESLSECSVEHPMFLR